MATSTHTGNYNLSQYAAGDPVKFLTNYNQDMAEIDAAVKAAQDSADAKTPLTRTIADLPLSADITLAQLIAAGLASGTNGDANNALKLGGVDASAIIDGEGNALNTLKLGGAAAANFPQISSGTWTPTLYGMTTAGAPVYNLDLTVGRWERQGNIVFIRGNIALTSIGGMDGELRIGGLPFVCDANIYETINCAEAQNINLPSENVIGGFVTEGGTSTMHIVVKNNTGSVRLYANELTNTSGFFCFSGCYTAQT